MLDVKTFGFAAHIAEVVGEENAIRFVLTRAKRGPNGRYIHLPRAENMTADHVLAQSFGLENAKRIAEIVGAGHHHIQSQTHILKEFRNRLIAFSLAAGFTEKQIEQHFFVKPSTLHKIAKSYQHERPAHENYG